MGIVVLYRPQPCVRDNILSYLSGLDKLIIWKNSPCSEIDFTGSGDEYGEKVVEMGDGVNVGLGKAYNVAVDYAREHQYTCLLTMDQDSCFEQGGFHKYIDEVIQVKKLAIFSPNYTVHDSGKKRFMTCEGIKEVPVTISSGTFYPVSIFDEVGMFRDDFFIEVIDYEFSLRAKQYHIPTIVICSINLLHQLNEQRKKRRLLWRTIFHRESHPVRYYYLIRNVLITKRIYPKEKIWRRILIGLYVQLLLILLYEENKMVKYKSLLLGYIHGKRGITGKYNL
ncbi:MAG: hypothetical protein LBU03_06695 [Tannerellaceae bacterium]|nr:hypothetical protein [Tannerellaceae bacterium]